MTAPEVAAALRALEARFRDEEQRLNGLDRAVGDGDHGATMARGFTAVVEGLSADTDAAEASAILTRAGRDFLGATGGATGTLFATLFAELGAQCGQRLDTPAFRNGLSAATEKIMRLGKAAPGDKTIVDALAPTRAAVDNAEDGGAPLADVLATAADAAERGAARTVDMVARRGRARYVPEGGRGHVDPGATSVALVLRTLAQQAARVA